MRTRGHFDWVTTWLKGIGAPSPGGNHRANSARSVVWCPRRSSVREAQKTASALWRHTAAGRRLCHGCPLFSTDAAVGASRRVRSICCFVPLPIAPSLQSSPPTRISTNTRITCQSAFIKCGPLAITDPRDVPAAFPVAVPFLFESACSSAPCLEGALTRSGIPGRSFSPSRGPHCTTLDIETAIAPVQRPSG